jgi:DNA polymerase-3 subunit beta
MSRERTNAVRFDLEQGKLTLISINPDVGEAREDYKGESVSIGFNVRYLLDSIQVMEEDSIAFDLQDPLSPTLMREGDGKSFKCVVMPMRI